MSLLFALNPPRAKNSKPVAKGQKGGRAWRQCMLASAGKPAIAKKLLAEYRSGGAACRKIRTRVISGLKEAKTRSGTKAPVTLSAQVAEAAAPLLSIQTNGRRRRNKMSAYTSFVKARMPGLVRRMKPKAAMRAVAKEWRARNGKKKSAARRVGSYTRAFPGMKRKAAAFAKAAGWKRKRKTAKSKRKKNADRRNYPASWASHVAGTKRKRKRPSKVFSLVKRYSRKANGRRLNGRRLNGKRRNPFVVPRLRNPFALEGYVAAVKAAVPIVGGILVSWAIPNLVAADRDQGYVGVAMSAGSAVAASFAAGLIGRVLPFAAKAAAPLLIGGLVGAGLKLALMQAKSYLMPNQSWVQVNGVTGLGDWLQLAGMGNIGYVRAISRDEIAGLGDMVATRAPVPMLAHAGGIREADFS